LNAHVISTRRPGINNQVKKEKEQLYVGTAESEHIEMYLKAIWYIREQGEEVKVSSIAKVLNIRQPSVVEMLQKLNDSSLVRYQKGSRVQLTVEGNRIGKRMIRNTRLLEVLMKDALKMEIDEASYEEYIYRCTMYFAKPSK
jgi:DtxR family Mn-dependent transcriptional regulator